MLIYGPSFSLHPDTHHAPLFTLTRGKDPPEDVSVIGPTVVAAGQLFTLTCRSSPANPPPTLTWRLQGELISPTSLMPSYKNDS